MAARCAICGCWFTNEPLRICTQCALVNGRFAVDDYGEYTPIVYSSKSEMPKPLVTAAEALTYEKVQALMRLFEEELDVSLLSGKPAPAPEPVKTLPGERGVRKIDLGEE